MDVHWLSLAAMSMVTAELKQSGCQVRVGVGTKTMKYLFDLWIQELFAIAMVSVMG